MNKKVIIVVHVGEVVSLLLTGEFGQNVFLNTKKCQKKYLHLRTLYKLPPHGNVRAYRSEV